MVSGINELRRRIRLHEKRPLEYDALAVLVLDVGESELIGSFEVMRWLACLVSLKHHLVHHDALRALAFHGADFDWATEAGKNLLASMFQIAHNDCASDCRRLAVSALGSFFAGTRLEIVSEFLANVAPQT